VFDIIYSFVVPQSKKEGVEPLSAEADQIWRERLSHINGSIESLQLPRVSDGELTQDEEWCLVTVEGDRRRIRFHDYASIYEIPGLYERIFYDRLKCASPHRVTRLLSEVVRDRGVSMKELRVLDLGAGNGMVADELRALDVDAIWGTDIIPEAREAALRDRKGVYDDYFVADMTNLDRETEDRLRSCNINALTTVATLGFGDIPTQAFLRALSLVDTPGYLAFNIKEDFLREKDDSGFAKIVRQMTRDETIRIEAYRRYQHRLGLDGEPLYYVAMVATKRKPVDYLLE